METLFENETPELNVEAFVALFTTPIGAFGSLSLVAQMPDEEQLGDEDVEVGVRSHAGEVVEEDGHVAEMHYELMTCGPRRPRRRGVPRRSCKPSSTHTQGFDRSQAGAHGKEGLEEEVRMGPPLGVEARGS
ncbi:MAG: hypothetical protein AAF645_29740, partial [Myxococcota bacterium]